MKNQERKSFNYFIPEKLYLYPETRICEGAKLLYPLLVSLSKKQGYCYATNKYLGKFRNKSVGTISRFVSQLNNEGFIRVQIINNGSGRHIFIVPLDKVKPLEESLVSKSNVENIENLSASLAIKMRDNCKNENRETLTKFEYPPNKICNGGLSKYDDHIINTNEHKQIIPKKTFYKFIRNFETEGNKVYCNIDYFYKLMSDHNWKIESEENPNDWKSYFKQFNSIFIGVENKKYSSYSSR